MECLSFVDLLAALELPELPGSIRRHVFEDGCEVCKRRLQLVRRLLDLLPSLALERVPERVLSGALKTPAGASEPRAHFLEAVLTGTSGVPAFRSGAAASSHRQLYRNGPFELDLALQEDGVLVGEVIRDTGVVEPLREGECSLYGDRTVEYAELDNEGCFRFAEVGPGPHVLVIASRDDTLVVPDLEIS